MPPKTPGSRPGDLSKSAQLERHCSDRHDNGRNRQGKKMKYMLLIYREEAGMQTMSEADRNQTMAAYGAYTQAMMQAGVMVDGGRLRPANAATTVRVANGKTEVLNGPYAETREQLGGYYMIEAPDLDAALPWAARCPGASGGSIEVRPIWEM